jgi:hypothetical protein
VCPLQAAVTTGMVSFHYKTTKQRKKNNHENLTAKLPATNVIIVVNKMINV